MTERADPVLTENDIARMTDSGSFQRGKRYFRSRSVIHPVREGNRLLAECIGSGVEPYQVRITLNEAGIEIYHCSCPRGGFCKHVVALALTYIHQPERFVEQAPLEERLAQMSHEDLVALVKTIVEMHPLLRDIIPAGGQASSASATPLSTEPFRQQVRAAVERDMGYAMRGDYARSSSLRAVYRILHSQAQRYAERGDWANAGIIYQGILEELCENYRNLWEYDESREAGSKLADVVIHLTICLEHLPAGDPLRQQWLHTLWHLIITDIQSGGYFDTQDAETVLIYRTTAEEWQEIEKQIRARLEEGVKEWHRRRLLGMLRERYAQEGREAEITELVMEYGSATQRINHLLQVERWEEAMQVALEELSFESVDYVVQHLQELGKHEEAVRLVEHFVSQASERNLHHIPRLYEAVGQVDRAAEAQKRYLLARPTLTNYQSLRQLCETLGTWQQEQESVLRELEEQGHFDVLTEIAVEEGDARRALEMFRKIEARQGGDRRVSGFYTHYVEPLRSRVAKLAEKDYPQEAIQLYQKDVDLLIAHRGRTNYAMAAQLLTRVRWLYSRLKREDEWQQYIAHLRAEHFRLPALQDELNQAGL